MPRPFPRSPLRQGYDPSAPPTDGDVKLHFFAPGVLGQPTCAYCHDSFEHRIGTRELLAEAHCVRDTKHVPAIDLYYCSSWCFGRPIVLNPERTPVIYRWSETRKHKVFDRKHAREVWRAAENAFTTKDQQSRVATQRYLAEHDNARSRQAVEAEEAAAD
jgi:hypothetical protein